MKPFDPLTIVEAFPESDDTRGAGPAQPCEQCGAREDFGETHDEWCAARAYNPHDLAWRIETTAGDAWVWLDPTSGDRITAEVEGIHTAQRLYFDEGEELPVVAQVTALVLARVQGARLLAIHAPRGDR